MTKTLTSHRRNGVDYLTISGNCIVTGKLYKVEVEESAYERWNAGAFIQDAMPHLSEGDREFLISGTSPEGWDELFKYDDDDDFEDEIAF
jgi:hypothetical protein